MVDYSLQPFSEMVRLNGRCNFYWIDHHKSAIESHNNSGTTIAGSLDIHLAGCELTWRYLFPDKEMPFAVHHLGRFDVWDHKDPRTPQFQCGLRMEETHPRSSIWYDLLSSDEADSERDSLIQKIISNGKLILEYDRKENEKYCQSYAFETQFAGYRAICLNTVKKGSWTLQSVFNPDKHDIMISFARMPSGEWSFSFYSQNPKIDVSELAKKLGGGGHRGAAGAVLKTLPF